MLLLLAGMIGMTLNNLFRAQALAAGSGTSAPGWGKAKNMIMIYLQLEPFNKKVLELIMNYLYLKSLHKKALGLESVLGIS